MQEAAARHSQQKKNMSCLVRWRFLERCIESASIGGQMETPVLVYPTQVWKLQPRRAATECATLVSQTNPRRCRRRRCRERLVDTVLRSAQSPEITALVYAAVSIPHHRRDHPESVIQPATHSGWQLVTPPRDWRLLPPTLLPPCPPLVCDSVLSALSCVC